MGHVLTKNGRFEAIELMEKEESYCCGSECIIEQSCGIYMLNNITVFVPEFYISQCIDSGPPNKEDFDNILKRMRDGDIVFQYANTLYSIYTDYYDTKLNFEGLLKYKFRILEYMGNLDIEGIVNGRCFINSAFDAIFENCFPFERDINDYPPDYYVVKDTLCESPIEAKLYSNLLSSRNSFSIKIQQLILNNKYRVDFLLNLDGKTPLIVECDGHEFHEKTKQQARRDKQRDRECLLAGYNVMRFTGSEIHYHINRCIKDIEDYFYA